MVFGSSILYLIPSNYALNKAQSKHRRDENKFSDKSMCLDPLTAGPEFSDAYLYVQDVLMQVLLRIL